MPKYNTHWTQKNGSTQKCSTQKYMVRRKNVRFYTKLPYPACISCHWHYQTHPHLLWEIVIKNPYRNEKEIILIFKYIQYNYEMWNIIGLFYLWRVKCIHISMPWMNVTRYRYGSIILPISGLYFNCFPDAHISMLAHILWFTHETMHSTRTFVIRVDNNIVFCRPHLKQKLPTLLPL